VAARKCVISRERGGRPEASNCPAIDGLIKEADSITGEIDDKAVLDAAIVANAQAVEHYEIARYGTLIAWAGRTRPRRRRSFPDDDRARSTSRLTG
jgi:ferritin-like metal-binding protein YciE